MRCAYWRKRNEEKLNKRTNGKKIILVCCKRCKTKIFSEQNGSGIMFVFGWMHLLHLSRGDATHQRHLRGQMRLRYQSNSPTLVFEANPSVYCQQMNFRASNVCNLDQIECYLDSFRVKTWIFLCKNDST